MSSENKTNFLIAIRGYNTIKKEKNTRSTDFTVLDNSNNKVLLRIIDPVASEYIDMNDIKNTAEFVNRENFNSAILISKKFTAAAIEEMGKLNIQYVSDDYMPPFHIEELHLAITNLLNAQCLKKCGETAETIATCTKVVPGHCRIKMLLGNVEGHFEEGSIGLLKNDLKIALALNR